MITVKTSAPVQQQSEAVNGKIVDEQKHGTGTELSKLTIVLSGPPTSGGLKQCGGSRMFLCGSGSGSKNFLARERKTFVLQIFIFFF